MNPSLSTAGPTLTRGRIAGSKYEPQAMKARRSQELVVLRADAEIRRSGSSRRTTKRCRAPRVAETGFQPEVFFKAL
jgi:hypothetical protein